MAGGPHTYLPVLRFVRCGAHASGLAEGVVLSLGASRRRTACLGVARGCRCREGGADQTLSLAVGDIVGVAMPGSCPVADDVPVTVAANRGHE